jgi:hypothetical protein
MKGEVDKVLQKPLHWERGPLETPLENSLTPPVSIPSYTIPTSAAQVHGV